MVMKYPDSWRSLGQVPSARLELLSYIEDSSKWNDPNSEIQTMGSDSLVGFLFDNYQMNEGTSHLVGQLIFEDEEQLLSGFVTRLWRFFKEAEDDPRQLHEIPLPDDVVQSAEALHAKLIERGTPEWVEE